jgi:hypothetical protein
MGCPLRRRREPFSTHSSHRHIPVAVAHLRCHLPQSAPHKVITHRVVDDSLAQQVRIAGEDPDIGRGANTCIVMWHHDPT